MKRTFTSLMLAVGLVSLFVSTPAFAQHNPGVAQVPFSFEVSGRTMPAGAYRVSQLSGSSSVFTIQNVNGKSVFTDMGARQNGNPEHPSLTFMRNGDEWKLVKIAPPNSNVAYSLGQYQIDMSRKMQLATMISIKIK